MSCTPPPVRSPFESLHFSLSYKHRLKVMGSIKSAASRYDSFDTNRSSTDLKKPSSSHGRRQSPAPAPLGQLAITKKKDPNLGSMVKKLIGGASKPKRGPNLVIPTDFIAKDVNKGMRKESSFAGLHKKLFGSSERKVLTEVKSNTRTLAMVLRSERELLGLNKDHQSEIARLNSMLDQRNNEVEKLKDLCLKQKEEIRSLKSAVLFPETIINLEKQDSELKQAKQLIPTLQRQVTSLTGQLHSLALDLAEVKADKYSTRSGYEAYVGSPKTPTYDQQDATNSLEYSSEDQTTPGSPDDMFLKDFNPCLTPYSKTKSNEFHEVVYESPKMKTFSRNKLQLSHGIVLDPRLKKMSKSSDCCQCSNPGTTFARTGCCRSDETKSAFGLIR